MAMAHAQRSLVSIVTALAFVASQLPAVAFGQNSAQAEVLFKEGQQLIADKKYAEACQRLSASFKLDPQPNTELLEGVCFTKMGKTASAFNAYLDASSALPKGGDAQKYAADQAKALEAGLLKVRVNVSPVAPGLAIKFDDDVKTRDKDFLGIDIALDPGDHDVTITSPGKHDFTKHFTLDTSNSPHTIVANLTDKTKEELDAEKGTGNGGGNIIIQKPDVQWSTVKTLGLVGTIGGGALLAAGGVSFILTLVFQNNAIALQKQSNGMVAGQCPGLSPSTSPPDPTCQQAVSAHQQALAAQTAADVLLVVGGVIGVTGLFMFIFGGNKETAPAKASVRLLPLISPNIAGLGVIGTF
jgi:hypothetical protein